MNAKEFGMYLRELRKEAGLTITQLAEASSVSQPHLSNIENGKRGIPSPEILGKLAGPLDESPLNLMVLAGHIEPEELVIYPKDTVFTKIVLDGKEAPKEQLIKVALGAKKLSEVTKNTKDVMILTNDPENMNNPYDAIDGMLNELMQKELMYILNQSECTLNGHTLSTDERKQIQDMLNVLLPQYAPKD